MSDYAVVHPLGRRLGQTKTRNRRPATLDGVTIGELSNHKFDAGFTFETIEHALRKRFPGVRFVSHERFGDTYGARDADVLRELPEKLRQYGCDLVISGNAG